MSGARTRPLHLLEVGLRWPPETFLQWKLLALSQRGFRVTVASTSADGEPDLLEGVELIRLPSWSEPALGKLFGLAGDAAELLVRGPASLARLSGAVAHPSVAPRRQGAWPSLRRLRSLLPLARLRPDVVHLEWESAAVFHLPLFDLWDCPVVVSCHGSGIHVHPYTGEHEHRVRGYETVFREAAAVHVVSDAIRAEAEGLGLDPVKARTIRPAVDPSFFRPSGRPPAADGFRVISVGDLIWVKGYQYGLQAIRHVLDEGVPVELEVLGDGPRLETGLHSDRPMLGFTIHDLGLADRVLLHGEVPSTRVLERLQGADALLHSSVSEGIPTVVLEAMACGVPVVVSDCGGVREAVTDGVEGFVVPKREPRAAAEALLRLSRDPALRAAMGRAGRDRVLAGFSLSRQTDAFEALYRELVASRSG